MRKIPFLLLFDKCAAIGLRLSENLRPRTDMTGGLRKAVDDPAMPIPPSMADFLLRARYPAVDEADDDDAAADCPYPEDPVEHCPLALPPPSRMMRISHRLMLRSSSTSSCASSDVGEHEQLVGVSRPFSEDGVSAAAGSGTGDDGVMVGGGVGGGSFTMGIGGVTMRGGGGGRAAAAACRPPAEPVLFVEDMAADLIIHYPPVTQRSSFFRV